MILITILFIIINNKFIHNKVPISHLKKQFNVYYLGKMNVGQGNGYVSIKHRSKGPYFKKDNERFLNLIYCLDQEYQMINHLTQSKCGQMSSSNNKKILSINGSTSYSPLQQFELPLTKQQNIWYFFLTDCDDKFESEKNNSRLYIQVQLRVYSASGSEFAEGQNLLLNYIGLLVFGLLLSSKSVIKLYENYKQGTLISKSEELDYPHMFINIAVIINLGAIMWKTIHYTIYAYNGQGVIVFDVFYLILHFLAHFLCQAILLLMAYGWAFTHIKSDYDQLYIPIVTLVGMLTLIVGALTKIQQNQIDNFHTFDSALGIIVIIIHLLIGSGFWVGAFITYNKLNGKIQKFFKIFVLSGSLYFLIYPGSVLFVQMFISPCRQFKFITVSLQILQMVALSLLTFMCISSKTYNQICYKNGSIFLPNDSKFY